MLLLDTNVISELRKATSGKANPNVIDWAESQMAETLFVSAITILELELGVLRKERDDPAQGRILRAWLDGKVIPSFAGRVLAVDLLVAKRCAALHLPSPVSERDALIAATALMHNMTVVTCNVADFVTTGVLILNPWDYC